MRAAVNAPVTAVLCYVLFTQGCFVDRAPPREPADHIWKEAMLAGQYGVWSDGRELVWDDPRETTISANPATAASTKYGIRVYGSRRFLGGNWYLFGGIVGLGDLPAARVELFGKEVTRTHWPAQTVRFGRDYSYEFFLVLRPRASGRGRIVKQWSFAPHEIALVISPQSEEGIRRTASSEKEAQKLIEQTKSHYLTAGYLRLDESTATAIVTVTGLTRPFEDRVDLKNELRF